ncbi:hypothetical protein [Apilactobacillus xinyiensis]|uniref:hypothetical protein n=1 Tax=Apilactobacillus xinyiensis TaxID=2841032 RepID=UPI00336527B4
MPEKSDKELAVELTKTFMECVCKYDLEVNNKVQMNVPKTIKVFDAFYDDISSKN